MNIFIYNPINSINCKSLCLENKQFNGQLSVSLELKFGQFSKIIVREKL